MIVTPLMTIDGLLNPVGVVGEWVLNQSPLPPPGVVCVRYLKLLFEYKIGRGDGSARTNLWQEHFTYIVESGQNNVTN